MGQRGCDCGPVGWDGMGWDRVRWDGMEHGVSGSAGSLHLKIAARRRTVLSHTGTCPWERKAVVLLSSSTPKRQFSSKKCETCVLLPGL